MGDRACGTAPDLPPVTQGVTPTVTPDAEETSVGIMLLRAELAAKDERLFSGDHPVCRATPDSTFDAETS
jgi:hypothetical protein